MRSAASCTIYRWQGQTVAVVSEARGSWGLPPLEACEWVPPETPVTSGVGKKDKKKALQPSTMQCCSQSPENTPALQLPLPNILGSAQTLGHCPFPITYNDKQLVQHPLHRLSGTASRRGKPPVISDSRGWHGPLPPWIPAQE